MPDHKRAALWLVMVVVALGAMTAHAAIINATVFVTMPNYDLRLSDGVTALPAGSTAYVVASTNSQGPPRAGWPTNGQCVDTRSFPPGDDVVYSFQIENDAYYNDFSFGLTFDSNVTTYLYLIFFDTTMNPVIGSNIAWGVSGVSNIMSSVDSFGNEVVVDFLPSSNLYTRYTNCFYVIPEPGSGGLLVMGLGLIWGVLRAGRIGSSRGSSAPRER